MRIALVNNFFLPRQSGSSHLTDALARGLVVRGHDTIVITSAQGAPAGEEQRDGFRVVRLPCHALPRMKVAMRYDVNFAWSPPNYRRLRHLLDEFQPDVVHQHGQFFDLTWMSAIWARRHGVPCVLTVHTALIQTKASYSALLWIADMTMVRPFLSIGRPTVVVIDWFIDQYVRRRYGLPADRITYIGIGVDSLRFENADPAPVRAALGLGDRPVILSLGHVIPLRNRLALVEALPYLIELVPDVMVVVVGDVFDERFLHRAEQLSVRDHIVVTGAVPREEVPAYVAAADTEAHDLQGYGLGTASLEVMAAGVPIVSDARPDNFPGVELRTGYNIVLVPHGRPRALARALAQLLSDETMAHQIGDRARRLIAENFSMAAVTDRHVELYQQLASDGTSGSRTGRRRK